MIIGLGMMVGSVPLFISAGKNRQRALAMTGGIKLEQNSSFFPSLVRSCPAVALRLRLP